MLGFSESVKLFKMTVKQRYKMYTLNNINVQKEIEELDLIDAENPTPVLFH